MKRSDNSHLTRDRWFRVLGNHPHVKGTTTRSMYELYRLATKLDYVNDTRPVIENLRAEFAALKEFIVLASDKDYYAKPFSPPLSLKKREVWSRFNLDIEIMLDAL